MKIITQYQCEICKQQYKIKNEAIKCEEKGVPKEYPKGLIFSLPFCGSKIVFCIIRAYKDNHNIEYSTWGCRDTKSGDNFGGIETCIFNSHDKSIKPPNKKSKAYKRMKEGLIKKGILPINFTKRMLK